jgi:hypothetical protein
MHEKREQGMLTTRYNRREKLLRDGAAIKDVSLTKGEKNGS